MAALGLGWWLAASAAALAGFTLSRGSWPQPAPSAEPRVSLVESLRLAPDRRLRVLVERPCVVAWASQPEHRLALAPGTRAVPAGPGPTPTLLVDGEAGAQRLPIPFSRVAAASLPGLDDPEISLDPAERVALARAFQDLRGWLPELLASDLPVARRRALFDSWQRWSAWRAALDSRGDQGAPPQEESGWASSLHRVGRLAWGEVPLHEVPLSPEGGADVPRPGRGFKLVAPDAAQAAGGFAPAEAVARALEFSWPAPPEGVASTPDLQVGVELYARRIPDGMALVLEPSSGAAGLRLRFWPSPESGPEVPREGKGRGRASDYRSVILPADLAPPAGTPMRLGLRPVLGPSLAIARVHALRLAWRPRSGG